MNTKRVKIEIERRHDGIYRVVQVTNSVSPTVGQCLTARDLNDLVECSATRAGRQTVVIREGK
jgi:hypothetical protein